MIQLLPYDRRAAVAYAHKWAYTRNPAFYDFSDIGGDCTNFASQCLYAGTGIMNFTPEFGWYYIDATDPAPAHGRPGGDTGAHEFPPARRLHPAAL